MNSEIINNKKVKFQNYVLIFALPSMSLLPFFFVCERGEKTHQGREEHLNSQLGWHPPLNQSHTRRSSKFIDEEKELQNRHGGLGQNLSQLINLYWGNPQTSRAKNSLRKEGRKSHLSPLYFDVNRMKGNRNERYKIKISIFHFLFEKRNNNEISYFHELMIFFSSKLEWNTRIMIFFFIFWFKFYNIIF